MIRSHGRLRALVLVLTAGTAWLGVVATVRPVLLAAATHGVRTPIETVTALAAAAVAATTTWLFLLFVLEVARVAVRPHPSPRHGSTLPARAGIAALVAALLGTTPAATAESGVLPSPDRAESGTRVATAQTPAPTQVAVVVRPGDSLWRVATRHLPGGGRSDAAVQEAVRRLHEANRAVIGPDPDHIHPGTRLRVPTPLDREEDA